jgi:hypothetical protein
MRMRSIVFLFGASALTGAFPITAHTADPAARSRAMYFTLATVEASYQSIPSRHRWGLAPHEMAWQGRSIGDICLQITDPERNGARSLSLLQGHLANDDLDDLAGWAWHPRAGRQPVPGTQKQFDELVEAWIDSGSVCP